ncbi:50S ribosomal protein L11 methyltransferase [Falsiroseomonas sp. E2-1-a20]|uniref:50S ribosomal protein L11 methyltransferase n=1 Tax=Falsiroseomonas sp. E2-1-a20 TaxID=3239300 RepID=UPI003F303E9D
MPPLQQASAHEALARSLTRRGALHAALLQWQALLRLDPAHPDALLESALLLRRLSRPRQALEAFAAASARAPGDPQILAALAIAQAEAAQPDAAIASFRRSIAADPGNPHLRHQLRRLTSSLVPFWHIPMLNDAARNDAFEAAILQALAAEGPDARVLDIGTGSGLLSLMAARAGATGIVTCEAVPLIAETARQIIALNGHEGAITVVPKPSTALVLGDDLPARADILVSEILSSDLLAEGVLDTFEDAQRRLLRPGAHIIPRAAAAMGCLIESPVLANYAGVSRAAGFDVSPFAALAPPRLPVHGRMGQCRRLSPDLELLRLDLTAPTHDPVLAPLSVPVLADGLALGVLQWMQLDLAEGVGFHNHPETAADGGWMPILHAFPQPVPVTAGSTLALLAGHDRSSLILLPAE